MNKLKFHEEDFAQPNTAQTKIRGDSFGLSTLLIKQGVVTDIRSAKRLSSLIMIGLIILSGLAIFLINSSGSNKKVDEKYYYDPTLVDPTEP